LADEDTELAVSRPLGRGFALDTDGPVALVGESLWVSPLKLLSKSLSKIGILHDVYLGVPEAAPATYRAWISENYSGAVLVPTNAFPDFFAHTVLVESLGDLKHYAGICASGPLKMLKAVKSAAASVIPTQLALCERMACANGSCYGCAAPASRDGARTYLRACIEGPVFPAEVLAW
jgi:dihydroorotate dehydrogenase electron transfer subunit